MPFGTQRTYLGTISGAKRQGPVLAAQWWQRQKRSHLIYYVMVTEKIDFDQELLKERNDRYLRMKLKKLEEALLRTKSLLAGNQMLTNSVR